MNIKKVNLTHNPLRDKIISCQDKSFKLWLEFEVTSPWHDLKNDFANINVDMMDGRTDVCMELMSGPFNT